MRRIRITVSYDGTEYRGWQVQPGRPTIQGALETVLTEIESAPVSIAASGRTDAGVHAIAQVAAFSLANPIPCVNLQKAINRLLPHDIRVMDVEEVAPEFHPRYDAKAKTYEYRIQRTELCSPFLWRYAYHHPYLLDEGRIFEYAPLLEGAHDFSAFAASDEKDGLDLSRVRTVFVSRAAREGDLLVYRIRGTGFLKHMVRNIVGVLLEAGKGNLTREDIEARLKPGSAIPAGPTAPARGLFLVSVEY